MANNNEIKERLLKKLGEILNEEEVAAIYREADPELNSVPILTALLENVTDEGRDCMAEFFFLPANNDSETGIFTSAVTFAEDVTPQVLNRLNEVASIVNFYAAYGSFSGDLEGRSFALKSTVMLPLDADEKLLEDIMLLNASQALGAAANYADLFGKVVDGVMSIDEVKALVEPE